MKRIETTVDYDVGGLAVVHKAVVYVVRFNDNKGETILLAANHRWREGFLMVVMTDKDIDDRTARKLFDRFIHIMCERCLRKYDGGVNFRFDLKGNRITRAVCSYCDPTVYDLVLPFDYQEVARTACKHRHD